MELKLINSKQTVEVADTVFATEYNEALIHQIVTAYMAGARAGTKAQKTRAEVSGGGTKPWKQKGSGRARAGTIRSPLWRKGGIIFAAKPRSFKQKVNKKMYRGALKSILSELIRQERLLITQVLQVETHKTKAILEQLTALNVAKGERVLLISDAIDSNLYLAIRNLPHVELKDAAAAATDPVSLIAADRVIATEAAIKEIEELLK